MLIGYLDFFGEVSTQIVCSFFLNWVVSLVLSCEFSIYLDTSPLSPIYGFKCFLFCGLLWISCFVATVGKFSRTVPALCPPTRDPENLRGNATLKGAMCAAPGLKCDQTSLLSQLQEVGENPTPLEGKKEKGYPFGLQSSQTHSADQDQGRAAHGPGFEPQLHFLSAANSGPCNDKTRLQGSAHQQDLRGLGKGREQQSRKTTSHPRESVGINHHQQLSGRVILPGFPTPSGSVPCHLPFQISHLLELCLKPVAEWTMTFRNP